MTDLVPLNNLIMARKEAGLTQDELAEKVQISRAMLSNIERGYTLPSLPVAYRIAKVLNCSIEYLFFNENAHKMNIKNNKSA